MKLLPRLLSARRRRPAPCHNIRLRCQRLEDRTVPASFQGLGFVTGGFYSDAYDVSSDGSAVVGQSEASAHNAYRWTAATGMVDLGFLPGGIRAMSTGVSADGSVVVGNAGNSSNNGDSFRWTAATGMVDIGGGFNHTNAVSGDGSAVVGQFLVAGVGYHAYRWTAATGMLDLGALPGTNVSEALGASADGSVIVGYSGSFSEGTLQRAFRWTAGTGMVGLGTLPLAGLSNVRATDVSADGSVVVGYCQASSGDRAFRWTTATGMVDLGISGATDVRASGVSADGSSVVGFSIGANYRAVRWTASGGMRDLQNDLVNVYGLGTQLAGWNLNYAVSCSADGRVIAGYGLDPTTNTEAWVATLDAPPQVAATRVNDGSIQRSRITDLSVTFSTQVSFVSTPGAAFTLNRNSDGVAVSFTATANVVGGVTVVTLDGFSGSATQFGSFADGRYTLTALASQISAGGQQMTSNYTFTDAQGLYRMYGDVNGDQTVNGLDFGFFKNAFGTQLGDAAYLSYLDLNGDGVINGFDFGQFRTRFGTMLP